MNDEFSIAKRHLEKRKAPTEKETKALLREVEMGMMSRIAEKILDKGIYGAFDWISVRPAQISFSKRPTGELMVLTNRK